MEIHALLTKFINAIIESLEHWEMQICIIA